MDLRFPRPLLPGDRIGVTAPSAGVEGPLRPRLAYAVDWLRRRGYDVTVGECLDGSGIVSAPKEQRAAELTAMLADPTIAAIVPPWGGETAIDLLDQLPWDDLAAVEPTWVVGFSDTDTWMLPLTLRLGWGTLHGVNLMDTPYRAVDGLKHWTDVAAATGPVTQRASGVFGHNAYGNWRDDPTPEDYDLDGVGTWRLVGGDALDATGRLVGGCVETLGLLAATPYGDVAGFGRRHGPVIVHLDIAEWAAGDVCRALHAMRYAGWFEACVAVLVSRTGAPSTPGMTQVDAVLDALGMLGVPIVLDVECGHVPPYLPMVNGAMARIVIDEGHRELTQEWR